MYECTISLSLQLSMNIWVASNPLLLKTLMPLFFILNMSPECCTLHITHVPYAPARCPMGKPISPLQRMGGTKVLAQSPIASMEEELNLQLLRSAGPCRQGHLRPAPHWGGGSATSRRAQPSRASHFDNCPECLCAQHSGEGQPHDHKVTLPFSEEFGYELHYTGCPTKGKGPSVPPSRDGTG